MAHNKLPTLTSSFHGQRLLGEHSAGPERRCYPTSYLTDDVEHLSSLNIILSTQKNMQAPMLLATNAAQKSPMTADNRNVLSARIGVEANQRSQYSKNFFIISV